MKPCALILGASGAFGRAMTESLAAKGYDFYLVYRERRVNADAAEKYFDRFREMGSRIVTFNGNINDENLQQEVIVSIKNDRSSIQLYVHSVADGNIGTVFAEDERKLDIQGYVRTFTSMAASFPGWAQLIQSHDLFASGARIVGLTSEGSYRVLDKYMAVGMAKAALEASCRYMAVEMAQKRITVNLINAGITDTPALKVFPGYEEMIAKAKARNPHGRLTEPADIARVIAFLASPDSAWITGTIIRVDGGEQLI
jgi:enoyl-[acyl-carrier protein] reductase I